MAVLDRPNRNLPRAGAPIDPIAEYLEYLTERSIRLGPWTIGLDGILGLIPGLGDILSGLLASYIVARAAQAGVPRAALARMMANVAMDTLLGAIPIVGDLFDFMYKANTKNLRIYRESLEGRSEPVRDWGAVVLFVGGSLLLLAIPIVLAWLLISRLLGGA
jgi:hypothetical protein